MSIFILNWKLFDQIQKNQEKILICKFGIGCWAPVSKTFLLFSQLQTINKKCIEHTDESNLACRLVLKFLIATNHHIFLHQIFKFSCTVDRTRSCRIWMSFHCLHDTLSCSCANFHCYIDSTGLFLWPRLWLGLSSKL